MADMLVNYAITKLRDAATVEIKFQLEINDEIVRLQSLVQFMHAAVKQNVDNPVFEEWVKQLRVTASAIEDLIDEFLLDMELAESDKPSNLCDIKSYVGLVVCCFEQTFLRYRFHHRLNGVDRKLAFLNEGQSKFQRDSPHQALAEDELDPRYYEDPDVVGIDKRVEELEYLVENSKEQMVITVCGMGGSGKTTLVKRLYKNIQKETSIECYAWVYVTQTFKCEATLRQMVRQFYASGGEKDPQVIDNLAAQGLLHDFLQHKRYVLILDDVWDSKVLETIEKVLPSNSRYAIIITTRDETVVSRSRRAAQHRIRVDLLDDPVDWDLFCKVAFWDYDRKGCCPDDLNDLAQQLVKKCEGLPLAIVSLAQLMSSKTKNKNPREWNEVLQSHSLELQDVNRILLPSYSHLPTHLKICFLYCAMLPKNCQISIKKLIRLWVAEGFVTKIDGKTLEDVAKEYFFQLSYRSLLQIIIHPDSKEPAYYQMHDFLRKVAVDVIGKENFGVILSDQSGELQSNSRRLVIYETAPYTELNMRKWKLRSLLAHNASSFCSSLSQMLLSIKLLRVLDLDGTRIESLPDKVGNLILLRFLGLRKTLINNLPDSLRKLRHLQTLDVRDTKVGSLPDGIAELQQLRHLLVSEVVRFSNLTFKSAQLQTLSGINLNGNQARELGQLTELRKLKVSVSEVEGCREVCTSIEKLPNLQSLTVRTTWNSKFKGPGGLERLSAPRFLEKLVLRGRLEKLPYCLHSHICLRHIQLFYSDLKDDPFRTLGHMPNLISLILFKAYMGEEIVCGPGSFPKLKNLTISDAPNLRVWHCSEGAMKCLESLATPGCWQLTILKFEMPEELLAKMNVRGPEYWKVQHIPKLRSNGKLLQHQA